MKIIQVNTWLGRLLPSLMKFIEAEDADIVCAQEVLHTEKAPGLFDQNLTHSRLSELYPYQFFVSSFSYQHFGEEVHFGNAIYSKFPIHDMNKLFTAGEFVRNRNMTTPDGNIRSVQSCVVDLPSGRSLTIANHHGYHVLNDVGDENTVASMSKAAAFLENLEGPLIFCGDMNVAPHSPAMNQPLFHTLRNHTAENNLKTTLSSASRVAVDVPCDYIFTSEEIQVRSFAVSDSLVSDHEALVMEFDL